MYVKMGFIYEIGRETKIAKSLRTVHLSSSPIRYTQFRLV